MRQFFRYFQPLKAQLAHPLEKIQPSLTNNLPENLFKQGYQPEIPKQNVIGFKIQLKGRTGSRSMKRSLSYGSLGIGRLAGKKSEGVKVDFARGVNIGKRGSTGVKVWIAYGN